MTMTESNAWTIDVLSIAKGDMRLSFTDDSPEESDRAQRMIDEMLRAGYTIFVETARGQRRVKRYNAKHQEYIIVESSSTTASRPERSIPARGTRAKAVGATAGG